MPNRNSIFSNLFILFILLLFASGCSVYENVTGYFNTYYNTKKLFNDAVSEIQKSSQKDLDTNYFALSTIPKGAADKFDKVIEKSNKVIQFYSHSSWVDNSILMMGQAYVYKGETESGLRKFKELLDNFPESNLRLETKFWRAKALYQSKKEDEVLREIGDIITEAVTEGDKGIQLQLRMLEAQIYFERGDYRLAAEKYSAAASIEGEDQLLVNVHYQLAQCYERLGEYKYAAKSYEKVREFNPDFSKEFKSRLKQGMMLSKAGEHNAALDVYDALWEEKLRTEERGLVEVETANNYLAMDDTSKALPIYRLIDTVYKKTDASAKGYFQRGIWYEQKLSDLKNAKPFYEKAKSEFPSSEITVLATRKSNYLTNYFKHYDNIAKYDSLLLQALHSDTLTNSIDSVKSTSPTLMVVYDSSDSRNYSKDSSSFTRRIEKTQYVPDFGAIDGKVQSVAHENNDAAFKDSLIREQTYVVGTWAKDRECLWNIAKKEEVYGNAWQWTKIWQRNREKIKDPDVIQPKWILKIPGKLESENQKVTPSVKNNPKKAVTPKEIAETKIDSGNFDKETKSKQESNLIKPIQVEHDSLQQLAREPQAEVDSTKSKTRLPRKVDTTFVRTDSLVIQNIKLTDDVPSQISSRARVDSQRVVPQPFRGMLPPDTTRFSKFPGDTISQQASKNNEKNISEKSTVDTSKNALKKTATAVVVSIKPDSIRSLKAQTEFEMAGLLYLEMDLPDSALFWYQSLIDSFPSSPLLPRAYYAMAEIYRSRNDSSGVDSLYNIILSRYNKSEYANQVKKILQMDVTRTDLDSAESVYKEGEEFLQSGTIDKAIERFTKITKDYPASPYAPKALYATGWIMETILVSNDSAALVYKKLIKDYPASVYAQEAKPKIAVKDDPKNLDQYVKIKEIPQLVKVDGTKQDQKNVSKVIEKNQQNVDQQKDQEIDTNTDESDQDEEPPPDEEDDGGGG